MAASELHQYSPNSWDTEGLVPDAHLVPTMVNVVASHSLTNHGRESIFIKRFSSQFSIVVRMTENIDSQA